MPRCARVHSPGSLVHVIVRFVNGEFRILEPAHRAGVLDRLATALTRADWTAHAYALMSNHLHVALVSGDAPAAAWLRPWLVSVAGFLNRAQGRTGPLVAERATTAVKPISAMANLARYIHNNPVRAGVVTDAAHSDWTSHRAWIGASAAPQWLDVEAGLDAAGFTIEKTGRHAFDAFVREGADEPRDPELSAAAMHAARARIRATAAFPLEIGSLVYAPHSPGAGARPVLAQGQLWAAPRWNGDLALVVAAAARLAGCTVDELRSRSRRRPVTSAREISVIAAVWLLRRSIGEVACALGVSSSAASRIQRRGERVLEQARRVADEVRAAR